MKKIINVVLVLFLAVLSLCGMTACQDGEKFKVGLIVLHDETSTYDKNFIESMDRALEQCGLTKKNLELVTGVPEDGDQCKKEAQNLAKSCKVVFADSFGHESQMIEVAKNNPDVLFAHATGTQAHIENLPNYSNAFASIYEGRYLAGVAAGMKINEMIANGTKINGTVVTADNAKIGYVGAYNYAEVISGYTAFYLGARSVCPTVTMDVKYTMSWYDQSAEQSAAIALIDGGCCLISQHADSYGAPNACESKGVPNVSYNGSTKVQCPNTYVVSSKIDWTPYFVYMIKKAQAGEKLDTDWSGNLATGSVVIDELGTCAAKGTAEKLAEVRAKIESGELHVFDVNTFTVNGEKLGEDTKAAVDSFDPDTFVVSDGYFHESEKRSAPYFSVVIDGINEISDKKEN